MNQSAGHHYSHGHQKPVLAAHSVRTVANSAAYLLPYLLPGATVLDVGCGPGSITTDMAQHIGPQGHIVGIEPVDVPLTVARERALEAKLENVHFQLGDVYKLPFADNSFDIVHAHQVLQHLDDPVAALSEMRRVCAVGGVVAARDCDYSVLSWYPLRPELDQWLAIYRENARHNGAQPDAGRYLRAWAHAAGFTDVRSSASVWCYGSEADTQWWGQIWADRVVESGFASQTLERGLTTEESLQELRDGWLQWGADPDAYFTLQHGEIVAFKTDAES